MLVSLLVSLMKIEENDFISLLQSVPFFYLVMLLKHPLPFITCVFDAGDPRGEKLSELTIL